MKIKLYLKYLLQVLSGGKILYFPPGRPLRTVVLTFDDGPHPVYTKAILEVLRQYQLKAVFFLTGSNVKKYPELVKLIYNDGHQIGNHAFHHQRPGAIGWRKYLTEVKDTQNYIEKTIGRTLPLYFRPPFGAVSLFSLASVLLEGFTVVMWSYDSGDSYITDPTKLLAYAGQMTKTKTAILLMHDDYEQTVFVLPKLLQQIADQGWKAVLF